MQNCFRRRQCGRCVAEGQLRGFSTVARTHEQLEASEAPKMRQMVSIGIDEERRKARTRPCRARQPSSLTAVHTTAHAASKSKAAPRPLKSAPEN